MTFFLVCDHLTRIYGLHVLSSLSMGNPLQKWQTWKDFLLILQTNYTFKEIHFISVRFRGLFLPKENVKLNHSWNERQGLTSIPCFSISSDGLMGGCARQIESLPDWLPMVTSHPPNSLPPPPHFALFRRIPYDHTIIPSVMTVSLPIPQDQYLSF